MRLLVLLFLTAFLACDSSPQDSSDSAYDGLTYFQDIKPIMDAHCVDCHSDNGIGPFGLSSYEEVDLVRTAVASSMESGSMPPWNATDGCNDYQYDQRVPEDMIQAVSQWVDEGSAEGNPRNEGLALPSPEEGILTRVDHSISMRSPYIPQESPDDYRCFLVDWPFENDNFVTGYSIHPNNPTLVHHVITFIAEPEDVAAYEAADSAEDGEGWTCFGGPGAGVSLSDVRWLGSWAPGGQPGDFPAGTGIRMKSGSKLVLQVHLNADENNLDEAMVTMDVSVEDQVDKPAMIQPWTNPQWVFGGQMPIPANSTDVTHEWGVTLPGSYAFTIHSTALHMHTYGRKARLFVDRKDGSETCLLNIDDWDFNWQRTYNFQEPVRVRGGDRVSVRCTWDNPTDTDLNWGEGTGDEMCLGLMYVTY